MKMQIRLALREEGEFWNAYLALPDTMVNAKLIGSIMMGPVRKNPEIKNAFMAVMQQILADAVNDVTGEVVENWTVERAPEAERSGHS
jgi:cytochrome c oxidase assembly factor CtaG